MTNTKTTLVNRFELALERFNGACADPYADAEDRGDARRTLKDCRDALLAALAPEWQPIETAPIDEWILIAATPDHVGQAIVYDDADINGNSSNARRYEWIGSGAFHPNISPTHWMPLPKHPEAA